jgi:hypothetical protein
VDKI